MTSLGLELISVSNAINVIHNVSVILYCICSPIGSLAETHIPCFIRQTKLKNDDVLSIDWDNFSL